MDTIQQRLDEWSKDLLDLSFRNRLLSLPRTAPSARRQSTIQLDLPDASAIFEMLFEERTVCLVSPPDPDEDSVEADEQNQGSLDLNDLSAEEPFVEEPVELTIPPDSARTLQTETIANRIALRLLRQARSSIQEQGINILFAAFGVLRWRDPKDDRARYSPLLLLPITIMENQRRQQFCISRLDDPAEFNLTLAERIRNDYGIQLLPDFSLTNRTLRP